MKSFPMEYKIKGITLDAQDMCLINEYYEIACTAEYIYENYKVTEKQAYELGGEVRRQINKYEYSESDAIHLVCSHAKIRPKR